MAAHNQEHDMNKETRYKKAFDYPELDKMGSAEFYRTEPEKKALQRVLRSEHGDEAVL